MATAAITWAIVSAVLTVTSAVVQLRQMKKAQKKQSYTYGEGALMTSTSNTSPVPIIYGKVRVAGNQIYSRLGNSDKTVYKLVALCEGPVQDISDFKIDDREWNSGKYKGVSYNKYLGYDTDKIDSRVPDTSVETWKEVEGTGGLNSKGETKAQFNARINSYTADEKRAQRVGGLRNIAYLAMQADANENLSSSFSISVDVEGALVDVYSGDSVGSKQHIYSNNPAWCILDFMTRYNGCGMSIDEIDIQSFIDAAKYFEEKDYTLNLCIDTQKSRLEWINDMMDCCRSNLVYKNGKYAIQVEKAEEVVQTYTPNDIHDLTVWFSPLDEVPDIYRITYISPEDEWAKVQAEASNAPDTYLRKQPMIAELELMGVTNFSQASRLAWFYLNQALTCQTYIEFKTDQRALNRTVGDVIEVTDYITEFQNKKFRIIKIEDNQDESIKLTCREYNEDIYNEKQGEAKPLVNIIKLNESNDAPPNIIYNGNSQYYNVNVDGSITSNVTLAVTYDDFAYSSYFKVAYKKTTDQEWTPFGNFDNGVFNVTISDMEVYATYQFRFQNVSTQGIVSDYTYSPSIYIKGSSSVPLTPRNFTATRTYGGIKLSWTKEGNLKYRLAVVVAGEERQLVETLDNNYTYFVSEGSHTFKLYAINNLGVASAPATCTYTIQRPKVTGITASNRYRESVDGVAKYDILVSWTPPNEDYYKRAEVWYKTSNEQAEYLTLIEGDIPADELNLHTGEWVSGGYGSTSVILPQAVVGDTYLIAVCAQDEYGGSDNPDNCPQIRHEVLIKSAIPNTPDNVSISFGERSNISWNPVENSDILYYEVRTNENVKESAGMLVQTSETSVDVDLNMRTGTVYVYAFSTSGKYSSPAKLKYSKSRPFAPAISFTAGNLDLVTLTNPEIPNDCYAIHYELIGLKSYAKDFTGTNNVISVDAGTYEVRACYLDAFGQGEYTIRQGCVVEPWIDGALIKEESITAEILDKVTQNALTLANTAIQQEELTLSIDQALKLANAYTDSTLDGALQGALDESFDRVLEEALENLDLTNLKSYVKVEDLETGVKTTMQKVGVLDGENALNVYTKSETPDVIKTSLVSRNLLDNSGKVNVYTKSETPSAVQTVLASKHLTDNTGATNVYTKTETDSKIEEKLTSYTEDTLDTKLASYATTKSVSDLSSTVASNLTVARTYADTTAKSTLDSAKADAKSKADAAEKNAKDAATTALNSYKTTVSSTYATKSSVSDLGSTVATNQTYAENVNDALNSYKTTVSNTYATKSTVDAQGTSITSLQNAVGKDANGNLISVATSIANVTGTNGVIDQKIASYNTNTVAKTYATIANLNAKEASLTTLLNSYSKGDGYLVPAQELKATRNTYTSGGTLTTGTNTNWWLAQYNVTAGQIYHITLQLTNAANYGVVFTNSSNVYVGAIASTSKLHSDSSSVLYDVAEEYVTVPANATMMWVSSRANTNNTQQACSACIKVRKASGTYSAITQLDNAVSLKVNSTDFNGNNIVNKINMNSTTTTIDGKYLHVTGQTVFDSDVIIRGIMKSGQIQCDEGVSISGGSTLIDAKGMTCNKLDSNGNVIGSVAFSDEGMQFLDKNGSAYSNSGRMIIGTAPHGSYVRLSTPWDSPPKVICMPKEFQSSYTGYESTNLKVVCNATEITNNGFRINCYTALSGGTAGSKPSIDLGSINFRGSVGTWHEEEFARVTLNVPKEAGKLTIDLSALFHAPYLTQSGGGTDDDPWTYRGNPGSAYVIFKILVGSTVVRTLETSEAKITPITESFTTEIDFTPGSTISVVAIFKSYYSYRWVNTDGYAEASVVSYSYNVINDIIVGEGIATFFAIENINGAYRLETA